MYCRDLVVVEDCQRQRQCNVVHGPRRDRLQQRHREAGLGREYVQSMHPT